VTAARDWTAGDPRLLVRTCRSCGAYWYLPRVACPQCHRNTVTTLPAGGVGTCVARTHVHPQRGSSDDGYALVLVVVAEGPTVMVRAADDVRPGHRVELSFVEVDGQLLPYVRRDQV